MAVVQINRGGDDSGSANVSLTGVNSTHAVFAAVTFMETTAGAPADSPPGDTPTNWMRVYHGRAWSQIHGMLFRLSEHAGGTITFTMPFNTAPVPLNGGRWSVVMWSDDDPDLKGSIRNASYGPTDTNPALSPSITTVAGDKLLGTHHVNAFGNILSPTAPWTSIGQGPSTTVSRVIAQRHTATGTSSQSSAANTDAGWSGAGIVAFIPVVAGPTVVTVTGSGSIDVVGTGAIVAVDAGTWALDITGLSMSPPVGGYFRLIGTTTFMGCWVRVLQVSGNILYIADAQVPNDFTLADVHAAEAALVGAVEIRRYA